MGAEREKEIKVLGVEPPLDNEGSLANRRILSVVVGIPPLYLGEVLNGSVDLPKEVHKTLEALLGKAKRESVPPRRAGRSLVLARQEIALKLGVLSHPPLPEEASTYASLGDPVMKEMIESFVEGRTRFFISEKVTGALRLGARSPYDRYLALLGRYIPLPLLEAGLWEALRPTLLRVLSKSKGAYLREAAMEALSLPDFEGKIRSLGLRPSTIRRWVGFARGAPIFR